MRGENLILLLLLCMVYSSRNSGGADATVSIGYKVYL